MRVSVDYYLPTCNAENCNNKCIVYNYNKDIIQGDFDDLSYIEFLEKEALRFIEENFKYKNGFFWCDKALV